MTGIEDISDYVQGESLRITFNVTDGETEPFDLTGGDVTWELVRTRGAPSNEAYLTDDSDGISLSIVSAQDGEVGLSIDREVTDDLNGRLWQRLQVDDDSTGRQIFGGNFTINRK